MTYSEFVKKVSTTLDCTQKEGKDIIDTVLKEMKDTILTEGRLNLFQFGTFHLMEQNERTVCNPRTGDPMIVPRKKVVRFRPSTDLRAAAKDANPFIEEA